MKVINNIRKIRSVDYFFRILAKFRPQDKYLRKGFLIKIFIAYSIIMAPLIAYSVYMTKKAEELALLQAKDEEGQEDFFPMVKVFNIKRMDFMDRLSANGTLKGTSEIELKFEIPGKIASFNFREGDVVSMGEIIVSLDPDDVMTRLRHSKSKLDTVSSRYKAAAEKLKVYTELYDMGAIIESKLREMELSAESIKAEVDTARSEVVLAQSQLDKTIIAAPQDGVMGIRKVEVQDFVSQNDIVGTFLEVKSVFVEMGVIEKDIEKIRVGQKVEVRVDAYPDEKFWGRIDNISKVITGTTRTLPVKVKLSNLGQRLYSGMYADCDIYLSEFKNAIIVPSESVIEVGEMKVVPLVKPVSEKIGIIELRKIDIGYSSNYTVIKDGLAENDIIVMETQQPLKDGMKVKIIEVIEAKLND
jgi:membrane fusion protein (multidrug efflux system)